MPVTPLTIVADFLFGIASIVPNLIFRNIETSIATRLTYMMLTHSVTSRYLSNMLVGTDVIGESTMGGFRRVVFPFSEPMSGPNICSAASTLAGVTGQFSIPLFLRTSTKVAVLGHPIVTWSSRALKARR